MTRRKCFISYHHDDADEVRAFVDNFSDVFLAYGIGDGVSDEDNFIDSNDTEYVLRRIRERYLSTTTVTIVMVGKCTWARKYVDWEIAATLRDDPNNGRSGLMGITLPYIASMEGRRLPDRLQANVKVDGADGYARWWKYPESNAGLSSIIEDAYDARSDADRIKLIQPRALLKQRNSSCS